MKVLKIIKDVIVFSLMGIFFVFAIVLTILLLSRNEFGVTQIDDLSFVMVNETLFQKYERGNLLLIRSKKIDKINEKDEIFVYRIDSTGDPSIEIGVVEETLMEDNAIKFENGEVFAMKFVIGEAHKVYPKLGGYLGFVTSKWGFLFIILVPTFLIFIKQLFSLILEIKYGEN